jgi:ligand-binding sensor domain-containing protein
MGVDSQNCIWTANNPDDYGDPGGVSMYDGSTWIRFDPDPRDIGQYFLALTVDGNDHVWAGSWTNWVFMHDGLVWTHYDSGNSALVGHQIEALAAEDQSVVWIGNHASSPTPATGGVARFDGSSWTSYTPANSELPDRYVYSIAAEGGVAYFGTRSHGTAAFDGVNWDYYETANEPHCNYITSIEPGTVGGRDDALYFGTEYRGVAVFDAENWSSYTTENSGLGDDYVNDVHVADGVLWVGSQFSGVWKYDGQAWDNYDTGNSGLLGDIIVSLAGDSQGTLWLGTSGWDGPSGQDGAVARYDGLTWINYCLENSGLIDDDALQVTVDLGDTIWIGTEEGVSKFDGVSTWTNYDSGNSGLIENHVGAIAIDVDNSKWFATQGGVSHLSGQTWTSYTTADGLPSNSVRDICISETGVVWIATAAGVAGFEEDLGWTAYTQGGGLGDDDVTAATVGPQGRIWFGTDRSGISVYDGDVAGVTPTAEAWVSAGMRVVASPNPFHAAVTIECALAPSGQISGEAVRVLICDVTGRGIRSLLGRHSAAGSHTVCWDGRTEGGQPVPGGVYLYRAESGRSVAVGRVLLVR